MVERNKELFRVSRTSAAPLAFRMVQFYMAEDVVSRGLDHEAAKKAEKRRSEQKDDIIAAEEGFDAEENVDGYSSESIKLEDSDYDPVDPPSPEAEVSHLKTGKATTANDWEEREALIKEILELEDNSRPKRLAASLIIALTRSIDSLTREAHQKLLNSRQKLNKFSNLVYGKS